MRAAPGKPPVMPNFVVIGAAKSGTTALYRMLVQHPQIYMSPVKEPGFFAMEGYPDNFIKALPYPVPAGITHLDSYQALFAGATTEVAIGEASTLYLSGYHPERTAATIRRHVPHARLIAILRHPVDRAYSEYNFRRQRHHRRRRLEPLRDFSAALAAEEERIRRGWWISYRYRDTGRYYRHLRPFFDQFPREQIRVFLYDDWSARPIDVLRDIFRFLEVDDTVDLDVEQRHNVTAVPHSILLESITHTPGALRDMAKAYLPQRLWRPLIRGLRRVNRAKPPRLAPRLRRQLTAEFRDEILRLEDLIGRDLQHWLAA
jgi:hypothetical protein